MANALGYLDGEALAIGRRPRDRLGGPEHANLLDLFEPGGLYTGGWGRFILLGEHDEVDRMALVGPADAAFLVGRD